LNSVLSALGGSNGIDVTSAVNSILYADRAPERVWQAQQATLTSQKTALNNINSQASTLQDDLTNLQDSTGALTSTSAASSDTSVVTASAADGTASSSHSIVVSSLATVGSYYSATQATASTTLPVGSFSITEGGTTTSFQTGSGVDTLTQLAAAINGQSLGVTANIITDSSGARLAVVANASGGANDLTISQSGGLGFTRAIVGVDASLSIDGVPITSASNTVTGAIAGVTLNLQKAAPGETINLSLSPNTSSIVSTLSQFVTDFNALVSNVNSQFTYNSVTNTAGVLQEDSSIQSLQSALLGATNYNSGGTVDNTLNSLGISVNSDGTLSLNTATLSNAIQNNSAAVTNFFQGSARDGFAASLNTALNIYTDPTEGAFSVDLSSISAEYTDLTNQTNSLELYLTAQQKTLTTEYNNADILLQQLPQQIKQTQAILNPNEYNSSNG
jgi:flagellar hook-associated protein 2